MAKHNTASNTNADTASVGTIISPITSISDDTHPVFTTNGSVNLTGLQVSVSPPDTTTLSAGDDLLMIADASSVTPIIYDNSLYWNFLASPSVNDLSISDVGLISYSNQDPDNSFSWYFISALNNLVSYTVTFDAPPVVINPIPDQSTIAGNNFSYTVPAGTFIDTDSILTYSATLAGGGALPAWLIFDANTQTFSGTPPSGAASSIQLSVQASDGMAIATDTFLLNIASNTINGTSGNDTISGTDHNDNIIAGDGNDIVISSLGADQINGGAGIDTISYLDSTEAVNATLFSGAVNTGGSAAGDVLISFENLTGSHFNDTLTGDSGINIISGDSGNDIIIGGLGADKLDGGTGADTASYEDSASAVTVSLVANAKNSGGSATGDILTNFENLKGSSWNDTLTGDSNNNTITGGLGADKIDGGTGIDTSSYDDSASAVTVSLLSGAKNSGGSAAGDTLKNIENLTGSKFNDILIGNTSANILTGGLGADTLTCGSGKDIFHYDSLLDSKNGSSGASYDTIKDFAIGQDKIDITMLGTFGIHSFSNVTITQDVVHKETIVTANGIAHPGNTDHFELHLTGLITLHSTDFTWG